MAGSRDQNKLTMMKKKSHSFKINTLEPLGSKKRQNEDLSESLSLSSNDSKNEENKDEKYDFEQLNELLGSSSDEFVTPSEYPWRNKDYQKLPIIVQKAVDKAKLKQKNTSFFYKLQNLNDKIEVFRSIQHEKQTKQIEIEKKLQRKKKKLETKMKSVRRLIKGSIKSQQMDISRQPSPQQDAPKLDENSIDVDQNQDQYLTHIVSGTGITTTQMMANIRKERNNKLKYLRPVKKKSSSIVITGQKCLLSDKSDVMSSDSNGPQLKLKQKLLKEKDNVIEIPEVESKFEITPVAPRITVKKFPNITDSSKLNQDLDKVSSKSTPQIPEAKQSNEFTIDYENMNTQPNFNDSQGELRQRQKYVNIPDNHKECSDKIYSRALGPLVKMLKDKDVFTEKKKQQYY